MSLHAGSGNSKSLVTLTPGALAAAMMVLAGSASPANAQDATYTPQFTSDKQLKVPEGKVWREWPYVGGLVTPNALNDGNAPFPEHHIIYIDPVSWAHYKKTGKFREGTVLAKELTRVRAPDGANKNGSTDEVSGAGYFMGEYSGFEITIKSKKLYPKEPGNWAYYTFGHKPEPYNATAKQQPAAACNACHEAAGAEDFVFTQFYPVLRAAKPK
ncbi:MAG: cytochrome P460 family protein [Alphaproteobacteria bacterium]|nr:cytochrome P460 family protein [Alphaproteobacteria bacterium]